MKQSAERKNVRQTFYAYMCACVWQNVENVQVEHTANSKMGTEETHQRNEFCDIALKNIVYTN